MLWKYALAGIIAMVLWSVLVTAAAAALGAPHWVNFIFGMIGGSMIVILLFMHYVERSY